MSIFVAATSFRHQSLNIFLVTEALQYFVVEIIALSLSRSLTIVCVDSSAGLAFQIYNLCPGSGLCADEDEEECEAIREKLENIDHVLDEQGIVFVATHELEVAKGRAFHSCLLSCDTTSMLN